MSKIRVFALAAASLFISAQAFAQATRTWVSGVGDDVNPCSRTAPCKTWAGAISKTAAGGEINALDPGGYGTLTITKAITIDGTGTNASTLSALAPQGFLVNAGPNDVVIIRNVAINGAGTGTTGIRFIAGGELHVDNVNIVGLTGQGIQFQPSGSSALYVNNVTIRNANAGAILIQPTGTGTAVVAINRAALDGNARGLRAEDGSTVVVRDSHAAANIANGFVAIGVSRAVDLTLENVVSAGNGATGIYAGALSTIKLSNSMVTRNNAGLQSVGGGNIISFGNNRVIGNTINNGPPNNTVPQM
jgi:hypothetical protein